MSISVSGHLTPLPCKDEWTSTLWGPSTGSLTSRRRHILILHCTESLDRPARSYCVGSSGGELVSLSRLTNAELQRVCVNSSKAESVVAPAPRCVPEAGRPGWVGRSAPLGGMQAALVSICDAHSINIYIPLALQVGHWGWETSNPDTGQRITSSTQE